MKILLMLAHSVAEYDDVRMFSDLGYDVFSIGAYANPDAPGDDLRPALPDAPSHPDLAEACADQMRAKEHLPDAVIDWADVIIAHHYLPQWIVHQWDRIRHKRIIWRTCGQSDFPLEDLMGSLRRDGLQIVRYSPKERTFFEPHGHWAGQDALIRFGKYPDDYGPWNGDFVQVANITQNMVGRGDWVGRTWYEQAVAGLTAAPAGDRSEELPGGVGKLDYPAMLRYLRDSRAFVYGGTLPAPYTLGLIEAMMTGIPVVSIGEDAWMGPTGLFEAPSLTGEGFDDPAGARRRLSQFLSDKALAKRIGEQQMQVARALFGIETIAPMWRDFLGAP